MTTSSKEALKAYYRHTIGRLTTKQQTCIKLINEVFKNILKIAKNGHPKFVKQLTLLLYLNPPHFFKLIA